ncbi:MAG: branched-chain amino acid ABC transporter permease, partial [Lachnospiraceae bacterium]|nr:branched-chain amino acid ABC transporter permease [Lachnospiraceae bacterium]
MKTGRISKTTKNDLITYAMVILAYIIMQLLVSTGHVSSLIQGLLVPFCTYAIVAIALNLTVGILGELSLGHAGFMCVGAFSSAVFSLAFKNAIPSGLRFFIALLIGAVAAALVGFLVG